MLMYERADEVDKVVDFACEFRGAASACAVITDVPGVHVGHWTGTAPASP